MERRTLYKKTFGKLIVGERFHFTDETSVLFPDAIYIKMSARTYARKGLTRTFPIASARCDVWSYGVHESLSTQS